MSAEGMKMRGMKNESNGAARASRVVSGPARGGGGSADPPEVLTRLLLLQDEDLKWVEDNIPSSMADV